MATWTHSYQEQVRFFSSHAHGAQHATGLLTWLLGTGGTIAGCATYLKSVDPTVKIILSDPEGSSLYNKVKFGVMYDKKEREGTKRRHQVSQVASLHFSPRGC